MSKSKAKATPKPKPKAKQTPKAKALTTPSSSIPIPLPIEDTDTDTDKDKDTYDLDAEFSNIQDRESIESIIVSFLKHFEKNKTNLSISRGVYLHGEHGIGKTTFIKRILKRANMDSVWYSSCDVRNKAFMENLCKNNLSNHSVVSLFHKEKKPIVIVMDDIDGMVTSDKNGVGILVKMLRAKKTKRQKTEEMLYNPIICIGNDKEEKKIKEIKKACLHVEFPSPTKQDMEHIMKVNYNIPLPYIDVFHELCQNDLRKLRHIAGIFNEDPQHFQSNSTPSIIQSLKTPTVESKDIVRQFMNTYIPIQGHNDVVNENERTIVGLLWHENIITSFQKTLQHLEKSTQNDSSCPALKNVIYNYFDMYRKMLEFFCFSDFIDRITFQKQIWEFNEITSLLKLGYGSRVLHTQLNENSCKLYIPKEIQFTKILTKYSNEFNNLTLVNTICENLCLTRRDVYTLFHYYKTYNCEDTVKLQEYNINTLESTRIYKMIEKFQTEHYNTAQSDENE